MCERCEEADLSALNVNDRRREKMPLLITTRSLFTDLIDEFEAATACYISGEIEFEAYRESVEDIASRVGMNRHALKGGPASE